MITLKQSGNPFKPLLALKGRKTPMTPQIAPMPYTLNVLLIV
jgi:hypothetical protein